ncbi:MAG: peptidylprolyl isomerase [Pirellulaceae bacterium]
MRVCRTPQRWLIAPLLAVAAMIVFSSKLPAQEKPPADGEPAKTASDDKSAPDAQPAPDDKASTGDAKPAAPAVSDAEAEAAAKAFADQMQQWKDLVKELRAIAAQYQTAADADLPGLHKKWDELIAKGNSMVPALRTTSIAAYLASPNTDRDLTGFLVKLAEDEMKQDRYEDSLEICNMLIENECDRAEIYSTAGFDNFALGNFDLAAEQFAKASAAGALSAEAQQLEGYTSRYKDFWAKEQEIRAKEAEADDLPRVKLTTNKGEIVVELFENEAPQTVGNFVSLVESKFYDGLTFHRVLPNFMAQGGDKNGDGTGGPGYRIPCECYEDDARMHFRGSLSMAHAGKDTGGSQFFITFLPTVQLNGRHTVFGRVIEGMDVLEKIQRRNPNPGPGQLAGELPEPDKIIKAEVIRKRDHEYKPTKIES